MLSLHPRELLVHAGHGALWQTHRDWQCDPSPSCRCQGLPPPRLQSTQQLWSCCGMELTACLLLGIITPGFSANYDDVVWLPFCGLCLPDNAWSHHWYSSLSLLPSKRRHPGLHPATAVDVSQLWHTLSQSSVTVHIWVTISLSRIPQSWIRECTDFANCLKSGVIFHFNDHTAPYEIVNTHTSLCLRFFTVEYFLRFFEIPFGAQGRSPPIPQKHRHSFLPMKKRLPPPPHCLCVTKPLWCVHASLYLFWPSHSASKNLSWLWNPNITTWLLCLGSVWEGYAVLI